MMEDDFIFTDEAEAEPNDTPSVVSGKATPLRNHIKEIILFTRTVIRVYPDGTMFVNKGKSQQWFQGQGQQVKSKEKPKPEESKKAVKEETETW